MNVLWTEYLNEFEALPTYLSVIFILLTAFCVTFTFFYAVCTVISICEKDDHYIIGCMITLSLIAASVTCIHIIYSKRSTESNYVKEKAVMFDGNKVNLELFTDYKVKEVKGEVYILEPIKPGSIQEEK